MGEEKKHILVVDDSSTVRQLVKMVLTRYLQCDITEAHDGVDAFEKLSGGDFDLMVTDINMPRMHGLQLVEQVRQKAASNIPIIIVTTKGAEDDRDTGIQLGANAYITKPINGGHLVETAKTLMA